MRGSFTVTGLFGLAALTILWFAIAGTVWAARNPTANAMTFWTHLGDALLFRALPEFQSAEKSQ